MGDAADRARWEMLVEAYPSGSVSIEALMAARDARGPADAFGTWDTQRPLRTLPWRKGYEVRLWENPQDLTCWAPADEWPCACGPGPFASYHWEGHRLLAQGKSLKKARAVKAAWGWGG
jgi:hypothetical protein